jgi:hypothetical protein
MIWKPVGMSYCSSGDCASGRDEVLLVRDCRLERLRFLNADEQELFRIEVMAPILSILKKFAVEAAEN